jgi:hypothetical protein
MWLGLYRPLVIAWLPCLHVSHKQIFQLSEPVDIFELQFLHQIAIQTCQLFGVAATVEEKTV